MKHKTLVSLLGYAEIPYEDLEGVFDFDKLILDIKFLHELPPVEVKPEYAGKELDYEFFPREVIVQRRYKNEYENPRTRYVYTIIDHAKVIGKVTNSEIVGVVTYTQEEVRNLRKKLKKVA